MPVVVFVVVVAVVRTASTPSRAGVNPAGAAADAK